LIAGDEIRAFIPPERKSVVLDVFADGDFAVQLEMPWRRALDVAVDIMNVALAIERSEREPEPEPKPKLRAVE
jgi:hypothetical protein